MSKAKDGKSFSPELTELQLWVEMSGSSTSTLMYPAHSRVDSAQPHTNTATWQLPSSRLIASSSAHRRVRASVTPRGRSPPFSPPGENIYLSSSKKSV